MKQSLIDYMKNGKNDEIYTPEYALIPLLKYLPKDKVIWECTDYGESNITKILRKHGYKVVSTHITTFDFLKDKPNFHYDIIITNPPYSIKNDFIKKCYETKKPFALLLPITALEGIERGEMFRENGISIIVLDKRINYLSNKKSNWFNTSWYLYNIIENNKIIFEKLEGR